MKQMMFNEQQRFKQKWLWVILLFINGLMMYAIYNQIFNHESFGSKPISNAQLIFIAIAVVLISFFFIIAKLDTKIDSTGIYYRFFPIHFSFRKISWQDVSNVYVRKYNPIVEYGGWGIRFGFFGKGQALNISGTNGMQIDFINNKKLLMGTQKPKELELFLKQIELQNGNTTKS
jgi:hypothetical protein